MLTQIQTIEPQAAILAACPRPRALAVTSVLTVVPATVVPAAAPRVPGSWSQATAPIAALPLGSASVGSARRPGSVSERPRPQAGYGVNRVLADAVRAEAAGGKGDGFAGIAMTSSNQQDKQDKQHLTARREPVTWRPPR